MALLNRLSYTYLSYKSTYSFQTLKLLILFRVIDPFLHYCFFALLALSIADESFVTFILLGNLVFIVTQSMISNLLSMFRTERFLGTLELNVASPTSLIGIIIKKTIIPILDAILVFVISLIMLKFIFNISFPIHSLHYLFATIIVGLFSLIGVSIIIAGIGMLLANVNLFLNLILAIFQIFCGINFPIELLPSFLITLSNYIPITNTVEAVRLIYEGKHYEISNYLQNEILIGIIYLIISIVIIRIMEKISKQNGLLFKA